MATANHDPRWHLAGRRQWGRHAGRALRINAQHLYSRRPGVQPNSHNGSPAPKPPTQTCDRTSRAALLTGAPQPSGRGLWVHRACQLPRPRMYQHCTNHPCWPCKGPEPKANGCCHEPKCTHWEPPSAEDNRTNHLEGFLDRPSATEPSAAAYSKQYLNVHGHSSASDDIRATPLALAPGAGLRCTGPLARLAYPRLPTKPS